MRTDRPTDRRRNMTKLIVTFRSFTNAPNRSEMIAIRESSCDGYNCSSRICALHKFSCFIMLEACVKEVRVCTSGVPGMEVRSEGKLISRLG
jgi:hypothetical protein